MLHAVLPFPVIDPVLIELGPFAIRWYGLAYVAGLLLGWWYVLTLLRDARLWKDPPFNGTRPVTADDIGDLVVWATLGVIAGGRLGYVVIYGIIQCGLIDPDGRACGGLPGAYLDNPLLIIAAWEGGMSFHGGLIGVVLALILFVRTPKVDHAAFERLAREEAKRTKRGGGVKLAGIKGVGMIARDRLRAITKSARTRRIDLFKLGDLVCCAVPIGLFFGRIANFINGELWGKPTDVPWAMVFPDPQSGGVPRHPSQLYEAFLEGIVLFVLMRILIYRFGVLKRPGLASAWFLAGYGTARAFVEFFRDSESMIFGWFSMGMALSLPMWAAAAFFFWYALKDRAPAPQPGA